MLFVPTFYADPFLSESQAIFRNLPSQPSTARKKLIDAFVRDLKTDGVWPKLGGMFVFAAASSSDALVNWKNPTAATPLSAAGILTFTANQGFTGNGTDGHISCSAPNTWSTFAQDDAHLGVWLRARSDTNQVVGDGATPRVYIQPTAAIFRSRLNDETNHDVSFAQGSGHWCCSRQSSGSYEKYMAGSSVGTAAIASVGLQTATAYLLRHGSTYSIDQLSAFHFGSGLTSIEVGNLNSRLSTLLSGLAAL